MTTDKRLLAVRGDQQLIGDPNGDGFIRTPNGDSPMMLTQSIFARGYWSSPPEGAEEDVSVPDQDSAVSVLE